MTKPPTAPIYPTTSPDMKIRTLDGSSGPGFVTIQTLQNPLVAMEKDLQNQVTTLKDEVRPLVATLRIPASTQLLTGKNTLTVSVLGMKKNDHLVVTPNAALPSTVHMAEVYCLTDGVLSVVLINSSALLTTQAAASIPLGIVILRPVT